jgi:hypothetical protein
MNLNFYLRKMSNIAMGSLGIVSGARGMKSLLENMPATTQNAIKQNKELRSLLTEKYDAFKTSLAQAKTEASWAKLSSVVKNKVLATERLFTRMVGGMESANFFAGILEKYPLLKGQFHLLEDADKVKFAEDFFDNTNDILHSFETDPKLLESWKLIRNCGDENLAQLSKQYDELILVSKNIDNITAQGGYKIWKSAKEADDIISSKIIAGLYESIDINYQPIGLNFEDYLLTNNGYSTVLTRVHTENIGEPGHFRRYYDPSKNTLVLDEAFINDAPKWMGEVVI